MSNIDAIREQLIKSLGGVLNEANDRPLPIQAYNPEFQSLVTSLATAEGEEWAYYNISHQLQHPHGGKDDAVKWAVDLLGASADDGWSGRGNDIRRAYYDGVRSQCKSFLYLAVRDLDLSSWM